MDWKAFFEEQQIEAKPVPFGLPDLPKPTEEDVATTQTDFADVSFTLPADYCSFSLAHGGGTLGRARIYVPSGKSITAADLRFHTFRLRDKFQQPDFRKPHSFPLEDLVAFASDRKEDMWFGWRTTEGKHGPEAVYCYQEDEDAPPPRKVADTFTEFVQEVALGTAMAELGIRRQRPMRRHEALSEPDGLRPESDSEEEDEDYVPPRTWTPLPGSRMMM